MEYELEEEIKVLNIDSKALITKLDEVGATKRYSTKMTIVSYDFLKQPQSISISPKIKKVLEVAYAFYIAEGSLRKNNAHLRLRSLTHTDKIEFTFKHTIEGASGTQLKQAGEYNAYLSEAEADFLQTHLDQCGLEKNALHEKRRDSYQLPSGCVCDIDTYPGIPTFIELEGTQQVVSEAIALLDLSEHELSQASGADFFARYKQEFYSTLLF